MTKHDDRGRLHDDTVPLALVRDLEVADGEGEAEGTHSTFKPTIARLLREFREAEAVQGVFAFDSFRGQVVLRRAPPWASGPFIEREITDADVIRAAAWVEQTYGKAPSIRTLHDVIAVVSEENTLDSLVDHLRGLSPWDGTERLDAWAVTYLGAKDSEYTRGVGRAFLLGAVGRGLWPGSKMDNVLVLEGEQDGGKSSAVAILGGPFASDELGDLRSRDSRIALRSRWIVELPELHEFERNRPNILKAFFSARGDRYRPVHGKHAITFARRCVFAATTNTERYLVDGTGNRRYWPIRTGRIDLEALARDRDLLLAEAVAKCIDQRCWLLPPDVKALAEVEQAKRVVVDDFERRVREYVGDRHRTATDEIRKAVGSTNPMSQRSEEVRIGHILRSMGYRRGQSTGGARFYEKKKLGGDTVAGG